ncbi:hypothetical protein C7N43_23510 [Sphingobacteriales bacterium UPWRP_1]|nr:hypothetical protein B6N25_15640 [Sphingobacteriales bacterium TSM_CSS]PSJ74546.1 hypothetical protein C7N43_23510 [Sphingobacteriales bacterium UPWRP_1]
MKKRLSSLCLAITVLLFVMVAPACNDEIEQPDITAGTGNFATYLAVGCSFTAGTTGDGLTRYAQETSYPSLLAGQLALAGGGAFNQPYLPEGNGSGMFVLNGLSIDSCGNAKPSLSKSQPDPAWESGVSSLAPFNNLGIPNMKVADINNGFMYLLNAYLKRMVSPGTTYLQMITQTVQDLQPTFFTNWLGITDALAFAATGGGYNGNTQVSLFALTDTVTFAGNYQQLLNALTATGAQGLVFTIPDLTKFPYFNAVSYEAQGPDSCAQKLPLYITTTAGVRKALYNPNSFYNDLILLPAGTEIGRPDTLLINGNDSIAPYGLSQANPLVQDQVLDRNEVQLCITTIKAYNRAIKAAAQNLNIPVIDTDEYFNNLRAGTAFNGISLNADFISGGFFGLDGIHPHDRGYALLTNFFIQKIDSIYSATIPQMDIDKFSGVVFP